MRPSNYWTLLASSSRTLAKRSNEPSLSFCWIDPGSAAYEFHQPSRSQREYSQRSDGW